MGVTARNFTRQTTVRAIIELEGAKVERITRNKSHLKIVISRDGVTATLITSENGHGKDRTWAAKFRADVRRALTQPRE